MTSKIVGVLDCGQPWEFTTHNTFAPFKRSYFPGRHEAEGPSSLLSLLTDIVGNKGRMQLPRFSTMFGGHQISNNIAFLTYVRGTFLV